MLEFIEYVVRKLVEHPDTMKIRRQDTDHSIDFFLTLHTEDIGKVIGRHGRTIGAIRTLLNSASLKQGKKATLEIEKI